MRWSPDFSHNSAKLNFLKANEKSDGLLAFYVIGPSP